MKGSVLGFVIGDGKGVIAGDDGLRYEFGAEDWKTQAVGPHAGLRVDFVADGGVATGVYVDAPSVAAGPRQDPTSGPWPGSTPESRPDPGTLSGTNPVTLIPLVAAVIVIALAIYYFGSQQAGISNQLRDITNSVTAP